MKDLAVGLRVSGRLEAEEEEEEEEEVEEAEAEEEDEVGLDEGEVDRGEEEVVDGDGVKDEDEEEVAEEVGAPNDGTNGFAATLRVVEGVDIAAVEAQRAVIGGHGQHKGKRVCSHSRESATCRSSTESVHLTRRGGHRSSGG